MDFHSVNAMRQMGYGVKMRRPADFWEAARGCGLGLECDDSHCEDGVETILIPETLWSDLPPVHVGSEWEPVASRESTSPPQPRSFSRTGKDFIALMRGGVAEQGSAAPKPMSAHDGEVMPDTIASEDSVPAPMSLRWDTSAAVDSEASSTAESRRLEEWQLQERWKKNSRSHPGSGLEWQPPMDLAHLRERSDDASMLSETSRTDIAGSLQKQPSRVPPGYAGTEQQSRSSSYSLSRSPVTMWSGGGGLQRSPISKGGDVACLPPELTETNWPMGEVVGCSLSAMSNMSCMSGPRPYNPTIERARVPSKNPPDNEVIDDSGPCVEEHSFNISHDSVENQASCSSSSAPVLESELLAEKSTTDVAAPSPGGPTVFEGGADLATTARPAKAACAEQESTHDHDSDLGGHPQGDAASSASSSPSHRVSSAPKPPECVAKLLFGRQATNRIMCKPPTAAQSPACPHDSRQASKEGTKAFSEPRLAG